jgi:hypothetical protein
MFHGISSLHENDRVHDGVHDSDLDPDLDHDHEIDLDQDHDNVLELDHEYDLNFGLELGLNAPVDKIGVFIANHFMTFSREPSPEGGGGIGAYPPPDLSSSLLPRSHSGSRPP